MPRWVMKIADDEYVLWSTIVDAPASPILTREQALDEWDEETILWVDKHLCSWRARLGERFETRNGQLVALGGGDLAYHFDSYAQVHRYMLNQRPQIPSENIATLDQLREIAGRR